MYGDPFNLGKNTPYSKFTREVWLSTNGALSKLYFVTQTFTRIILSIYALYHQQINYNDLPKVFMDGFCYDFVIFVLIHSVVYLFQAIIALFRSSMLSNILNVVGFFLFSAVMYFTLIGEILFWDEFGTRFNFIAVDYLVYTHKIIGTAQESLPIPKIIGGFLIFSMLVIKVFFNQLTDDTKKLSFKKNLSYCIFLSVVGALLLGQFSKINRTNDDNVYAKQLGKNGLYEILWELF
jgi:hypothetical protein